MTICRKCGKEIPDGQEWCEECQNLDASSGESYLDELIQDMELEADTALNSVPKVKPEPEPEVEFEEPEPEPEPVIEEEPEPMPEAEFEEPEPEPEPVIEEEPEPMPEAEFEEPEPVIEEEPEPMPEAEFEEPEPEPEPVIEEEPEPMPEAEFEEPEPELEPEEVAFEEPELEPEPVIEEEPMPEPEPEVAFEVPEPEPMPEPEIQATSDTSAGSDDVSDDITELLTLLEKEGDEDFDDAVFEESSESDDPVSVMPEESVAMPEISLFGDDDDDDDIFADSRKMASVDDVFQDALSAVSYSEREDDGVIFAPEGEEESGSEEVFALDDAGQEFSADEDGIPEEDAPVKKIKGRKAKAAEKEKTDSFWKKIFGNIITEQTREEEEKERELEKASEEERAAAKEEKKKKAEEEKAVKAEEMQAEKEKKAALKAEKAAEKAAAKEEKKRQKAELAATEVVGKINPVGATIVMVFFGLICIAVILGTMSSSYSRAVKSAQKEFEDKDYLAAYEAVAGVDVSDSSKVMKDKVRICMQLQKELNSYDNYYKMRMYLEALDSLIKGIRLYDANLSKADEYEILNQYNELEGKIASTLYNEFGVGETEARSIIESETQEEYTAKLEEIIKRWEAKSAEDVR